MVKIQTKIVGQKWVDCEHKTWEEIRDDGWKFICLTNHGTALMNRNGYINEFRQV